MFKNKLYFSGGCHKSRDWLSWHENQIKITQSFLFSQAYSSQTTYIKDQEEKQLEQLECLNSEDTPAAPWLPILLINIESQVKQDKVKGVNLKKLSNFKFQKSKKKYQHTTHLLKLVDKMCKYEIDPASIVEHTERTLFCSQADRRTRWNQYTPLQIRWADGIMIFPIPAHWEYHSLPSYYITCP